MKKIFIFISIVIIYVFYCSCNSHKCKHAYTEWTNERINLYDFSDELEDEFFDELHSVLIINSDSSKFEFFNCLSGNNIYLSDDRAREIYDSIKNKYNKKYPLIEHRTQKIYKRWHTTNFIIPTHKLRQCTLCYNIDTLHLTYNLEKCIGTDYFHDWKIISYGNGTYCLETCYRCGANRRNHFSDNYEYSNPFNSESGLEIYIENKNTILY